MAGGEGLSETVPGFGPAGALRATKFVPDKLVEPRQPVADSGPASAPPLTSHKKSHRKGGFFYDWLGERDSNPRWRSQSPQSYH